MSHDDNQIPALAKSAPEKEARVRTLLEQETDEALKEVVHQWVRLKNITEVFRGHSPGFWLGAFAVMATGAGYAVGLRTSRNAR